MTKRAGGRPPDTERKDIKMHITTDITGETLFVHKRKGQIKPHFIISGCGIDRLDKRKIHEYLNGCDWSDRACPAWYPATMRPDDFMKKPL